MKRILLPAGGAILATGLLAAGLAGTANANAVPDWASDTMAKDAPAAAAVAEFWSKANGAHQQPRQGQALHLGDQGHLQAQGQRRLYADTKASTVAPIGEEKKTTSKVKNVNLPKTIGKVFFVGSDGNLNWCSGTSIQGKYKNLVATAGHCVYDTRRTTGRVDKWVFVPGYYQGKTPFGIYVGKRPSPTTTTRMYKDFDRDYAFVTVYNGIGGVPASRSKVTKAEYEKYEGQKEAKEVEVSKDEFDQGPSGPEDHRLLRLRARRAATRPLGRTSRAPRSTKEEVSEATY